MFRTPTDSQSPNMLTCLVIYLAFMKLTLVTPMEEGARLGSEMTNLGHRAQDSEPALGIPARDPTHWARPEVLPHPELVSHPQLLPHPEPVPQSEVLPLPDAYIFLFRNEMDALKWSDSHGGAGVGGVVIPEPQTIQPAIRQTTSSLPYSSYAPPHQSYISPYPHITPPYQHISPGYHPPSPGYHPPSPGYHPPYQPFAPHYQQTAHPYPPVPPPHHEIYDVFRDQDFGSPQAPLGFPSQANLPSFSPGRNVPGPSRKWTNKAKKKVASSGSATNIGKNVLEPQASRSSEPDQIMHKNLAALRIDSKDKQQIGSSEGSSVDAETPEAFKESQASNSEEVDSLHAKESLDHEAGSSTPMSANVDPSSQDNKVVPELVKVDIKDEGASHPISPEKAQKKSSFLDAVLSFSTEKPESSQTVRDGALSRTSVSQKFLKDKMNLGQKKVPEQGMNLAQTVKKGKGSRLSVSQQSTVDKFNSGQRKVPSAAGLETSQEVKDSSIPLVSDQRVAAKVLSNEDKPSSSNLNLDSDGWQVYINKKSQKGTDPTLFSASRSAEREAKSKISDTLALQKDKNVLQDKVQMSVHQAQSLPEQDKVETSTKEGEEFTEVDKQRGAEARALVEKIKSSKSAKKKGKSKQKNTPIVTSSESRSGRKAIDGSSKKTADDLALEEALALKQSTLHRLSPEHKEHIKKVVFRMLQKDNPQPFARILINMPEYNLLFKGKDLETEEAMQELILGPIFQELIDSVGNEEGQRRHRALRDQLDGRVIQNQWQLGLYHNTFSEPIKKVAKSLSIEEAFPIFYDAKPGHWENVREELIAMDETRAEELHALIDYYQVDRRLAMIWAMQQANLKGDIKFTEEGLRSLSIQGINLPMLLSLCDLMELHPLAPVTSELIEPPQLIRYLDIYRLMHGKFTTGHFDDVYDMEDDLNWIDSPVRYYLTKNNLLQEHFQNRLKAFAAKGRGLSIPYMEWCKSIGIEWDQRIKDVHVSLAEGLISAHFGIPLEDLIILRNKIQQHERLRQTVINRINKKKPVGNALLFEEKKDDVHWPKGAEDLLPKFENFRNFYDFFGKKLIINKSHRK